MLGAIIEGLDYYSETSTYSTQIENLQFQPEVACLRKFPF